MCFLVCMLKIQFINHFIYIYIYHIFMVYIYIYMYLLYNILLIFL